jgi:NSS family neurotransmitter:Na+ symporter
VVISQLDGRVVIAALGQAFFSLSLGGTFMVVYGSYLERQEGLRRNAAWTAGGDLVAGLLAGLAIVPAVIALGMEPGSGPGLIFSTLPKVCDQTPLGGLFGLLFFVALFGAAYLSAMGALEVLVAGVVDNTSLSRPATVWLYHWLRFAVPAAILLVAVWWLLTSVL